MNFLPADAKVALSVRMSVAIGSVEKLAIDFSSGNPIILPLHPANIDMVHKKFTQWADFKLQKLEGMTKKNFDYSVKSLLKHSGISSIDTKISMCRRGYSTVRK